MQNLAKPDDNKTKKGKKKPKVKVFTKKKKQNKGGTDAIEALKIRYDEIVTSNINTFADIPLSQETLKGLRDCDFKVPTEIQKETIKLSLTGKDILGAAQTGSGKTLAFLIPILERLYCEKWTKLDGLGALVITPTRELAYQIFEQLRMIGRYHDFSAGLVIGGKDLKFERKLMDQCNIIICTPGRLLQHMDQNPLFDSVNLQILILDEADRCLDMGFQEAMDAIISNLPMKRQTLLFSATQTKSVRDLGRLSLKDPKYVSVHEHSQHSTPKNLQQTYVVCELKDKLSILWSFINNHLNKKIIIFLATCKQVKYMHEIFSKLRPKTSLWALYGTLHQLRRMSIYESFSQKSSGVLFATDIAARGLDFPEVHWVVQGDCPEDADTYIHRVGRTARYLRGGQSLLLLMPSELEMVKMLQEKKIPIEKTDIDPDRLKNPARKIEVYLNKLDLNQSAQRAFVAYAKSVYLMKNKKVFKIQALDMESYAYSLGLSYPPRLIFLDKLNMTYQKSTDLKLDETTLKNLLKLNDEDDEVSETEYPVSKLIKDETKSVAEFDVSGAEEDVGIENKGFSWDYSQKISIPVSKSELITKTLRNNRTMNQRIIFTDEDESEHKPAEVIPQEKDKLQLKTDPADERGVHETNNINTLLARLKEQDKLDRQLFKGKVKSKHKKEKEKLKDKKRKEAEEDESSDSDDEPDLSWLPDPDKIYGKAPANHSESNSDSEVNSQARIPLEKEQKRKKIKVGRNTDEELMDEKTEQVTHLSSSCSIDDTDSDTDATIQSPVSEKGQKRTIQAPPNEENSIEKKRRKIKGLPSSLNVNEAEEIALMLLKNK